MGVKVLGRRSHTPTLQYSITPTLLLVSNILCEPLKRQGMAESLGLRQIVGGAADGGELEP